MTPARCTKYVALLVCAVSSNAFSQGRSEDYQRADSLRRRFQDRVFRSEVDPNWFADGRRFWYRLQVGPGKNRYYTVDTETGRKEPSFDHEAFAAALTKATDGRVDATNLPIRSLRFSEDGDTVWFAARGRTWEFNSQTNTVKPAEVRESTVRVLPFPRAGTRRGAETYVQFINRTQQPVKLFWLNDVRSPQYYANIAPGEQHEQHTFGGHTWLVTDEDDRPVGVFEATDERGVAVIDGTWKPQRRRGRGRGRSPRGNTSPDQRWQVLIRESNVVLRDQQSEDEFTLTKDGTADDAYQSRVYWSPDSTRFVLYQRKAGDNREVQFVESSPRDQLQPKVHRFSYDKPGDRIAQSRPRLFDVETKQRIDVSDELFSNPWRINDLQWAADSSSFSFLYNQRGHQVLRLVSVDARSGKSRTVVDEVAETFVCYSHKSFLHRLEETNELVWMSERDGWNHLYLYDATSGQIRNQITKGQWVVRDVDLVDENKRQIWFRAGGIHPGQDPYHVHHCRINFDGTGLVVLTHGDGTHQVEFSPDRTYFVDTYSRVDLPPVSELRKAEDGSLVCELETADISALKEAGWHPPERFVAKGRDGQTDIYGLIYRPMNFDPQAKYPVVEYIYAGPHSAHVPKRFSSYHSAQAMAELGFVLVRIDGMGTSHRSKKFHDVCWQNLGDAGFPDRVRWIQAAAEDRTWMDTTRVGIYGGSAGGQNAMRALISHGDFYQVAVADCGCHDNRMDKIWWNEQWMGWPVGPHYGKSSNVDQAHRMEGKLLLIVGELDRNVDPASTMQVVNALVKADKDFDLVVIPGAGHGAAGTPYGRRRQRDFLVRNLLGVEPRTSGK